MALLKIAKLGEPVLRRRADDVPADQIGTAAFQQFVDDMIETMRDSDGVGLAAPQVFRPWRVIVVEVAGPNPRYPGQPGVPLTVMVNPVVVRNSDGTEDGWEGCLSIPDLRGVVPRRSSITVDAVDRDGEPMTVDAAGFFARVIQHEIDHLDGVIFLDRMADMRSLSYLREFQRHQSPK